MKQFDVEPRRTKILDDCGAFFAFSNAQFEAQSKEGVTYVSAGSGLICPKDTINRLLEDFQKLIDEQVAWELANNTKKEIIWYQLANHEVQISYDLSTVTGLLSKYGITPQEIKDEFAPYMDHCREHDLF